MSNAAIVVEVVTPSASPLTYYTGTHFWYPSPRFSEASRLTAGSGGSAEPSEDNIFSTGVVDYLNIISPASAA